jgi:hypothetical protein
MTEPISYRADYYYKKPGFGGLGNRKQRIGSVGQDLAGETTESAVLTCLRNKHPGYEINLMKLEWK